MSGSSTTWSGPGLIQVFINLRKDTKLSQPTLEKWLDEVYIPAQVETGVVKGVRRFKAANPSYDKQNLVIYHVPDLAALRTGKLEAVPRSSELFPTEEPVDAFVESDSRVLSEVEVFEKERHAPGELVYAG